MIDNNSISKVKDNRKYFEQKLLDFLLCDTMLFYPDNLEIYEIYGEEIGNVLNEFNQLLGVDYRGTKGLCIVEENKKHQEKVDEYFSSIDVVLLAKIYAIAIKVRSVILSVLLVNSKIKYEKCIELSFFEENFQQKKWGESLGLNEKKQAVLNEIKAILEE